MILGIDIHLVFRFLGTPLGELVKHSVEFLFFMFITYMVASEYSKNSKKDLKYLTLAFSALSFWKAVDILVLAGNVYGNVGILTYASYFSVIDHTLEVLALVLLSNAFVYPLIKGKTDLKNRVFIQSSILFIIFLLFQTAMIIEAIYFNINAAYIFYHSDFTFTLIKILLLLYAINIMSMRTEIRYRYRYSVIIALLVYLITPLLHIINLMFYSGTSARLSVAEHPFPLLSVILFARVIYLKLVDKAYLKKQLDQEKALGKMKDKFVSVVSHELRTPLTSIKLYCSLLLKGKLGRVSKKQKDAVSIISEEAKRLNELVTDMLDLSRLEDRRVKLKITSFDLNDLASGCVVNNLAEEKKIKLVLKIPKGFIINADKGKIKQVFVNLVSNAIKYSPEDTTVKITSKKSDKNTVIEIKDQGYGIPPEELPKIFDKFYQIEHHMTRKVGGTGLGLAIVKEIVELHKGKIDVKSKVGKGTTFTISLPNDL